MSLNLDKKNHCNTVQLYLVIGTVLIMRPLSDSLLVQNLSVHISLSAHYQPITRPGHGPLICTDERPGHRLLTRPGECTDNETHTPRPRPLCRKRDPSVH